MIPYQNKFSRSEREFFEENGYIIKHNLISDLSSEKYW